MQIINEIQLKWMNLTAIIRDGILYNTFITIGEENIALTRSDVINLNRNLNELVEYIDKNAKWKE